MFFSSLLKKSVDVIVFSFFEKTSKMFSCFLFRRKLFLDVKNRRQKIKLQKHHLKWLLSLFVWVTIRQIVVPVDLCCYVVLLCFIVKLLENLQKLSTNTKQKNSITILDKHIFFDFVWTNTMMVISNQLIILSFAFIWTLFFLQLILFLLMFHCVLWTI